MTVFIRDDAWPRMRALAAKMGWEEIKAIGCVVSLWKESQALGLSHGSRDEILFWCQHLDTGRNTETHLESDKLISVLQDRSVRLVSLAANDSFEIHGNKEEIKKVSALRKQRTDAVNKRWKKRISKNGPQYEPHYEKPVPVIPKPSRAKPSRTEQNRAEPDSIADVPSPTNLPTSLTPGSKVWNAYQQAYESAYQQTPPRNSKSNSLCKQLVDRLGEEGAILVVRFYLTHRNAYYVQRCHPLSACVHDAEGLHTQAKAGHRISTADARAQDLSQANEQTFAAVAARMEARRAGKEVPDAAE